MMRDVLLRAADTTDLREVPTVSCTEYALSLSASDATWDESREEPFPQVGGQIVQIRLHADSASTDIQPVER